jgi:hypothetical protein
MTERLRLEPMTAEQGHDLHRLHLDPAIAAWWDISWTPEEAQREAERFAAGWQADGISKWMATRTAPAPTSSDVSGQVTETGYRSVTMTLLDHPCAPGARR